MTNLKKFYKDESGATAIEYGLLAALISVVGIGAFSFVGSELTRIFNDIATTLDGVEVGGAED